MRSLRLQPEDLVRFAKPSALLNSENMKKYLNDTTGSDSCMYPTYGVDIADAPTKGDRENGVSHSLEEKINESQRYYR